MILKNEKFLRNYIIEQGKRIEKALIYQLEYLVASLQNHAKLNGEYQDRTSNLRGSIGGVVLKDGRPVSYKGFDSYGSEGNKEGMEFVNSLISKFRKGYVMIIVAGMDYATYVENKNNLNVLKKTELKAKVDLQDALLRLKRKIDENTK